MKVILLTDMDNLGYADDVVDVKPGYANNYLLPRGLARVATESALKDLAERVKQRAHKEAKVVADAHAFAEKIAEVPFEIKVNAQDGRIFGSITPQVIADMLAEKGYEVDRRDIAVNTGIMKTVGEYDAQMIVYRDIIATINFTIVANE